jgi:hypothetical protein
MARSRRSYKKSTSQQAVSLFASTLPRPLQYIAHTQLGSRLLVFGIPALIIAGVLQLNWDGGLPHFTVDQNRAAELRNAARDELGRISDPATLQQIERSATNLWNASQGQGYAPNPPQNYSHGAGYPSSLPQSPDGYGFPSSSRAYPQATQQPYSYSPPPQQPNYPYSQFPQPNYPYSQPGYAQTNQQLPNYSQPQPQFQQFQPQSQTQNPWRR